MLASRESLRAWFGIGLLLINACASPADELVGVAPQQVLLRVEWHNPTKRDWAGHIRIQGGQIQSARPLELRSGDCLIEESVNGQNGQDTVRFQTAAGVPIAGLLVRLSADPSNYVELELDGQRLQARLATLLAGKTSSMNWEGIARIRRDPSDLVRVYLSQPHLILNPGSEIQLPLELDLRGIQCGPSVEVNLQLNRTEDNQALGSKNWNLEVPASRILSRRMVLRLPKKEGVYNLVFQAKLEDARVSRRTQIVVLEHTQILNQPIESDELVLFDQALSGNSITRLIPRTAKLGQWIWNSIRQTAATEPDSSHQISFRARKVGTPHTLTLESDPTASFRVTTRLESTDWGIEDVWSSADGGDSQIFWPPAAECSVSIHPPSLAEKVIKRLRISSYPDGLTPLEIENQQPQRQFALFLSGTQFWDKFGRHSKVDPELRIPLHEWDGFLQAGKNITEFARFAGYNAVVVPALSKAAAHYPTKLAPIPLAADTGRFIADSPDPTQKDLVRLMARLCNRANLSTWIGVRPDFPLPALHRQHSNQQLVENGVLLVSKTGTTWQQSIRYNPLNPTVQQATLSVMSELSKRYKNESIDGVVLELTGDCHTLHPSLDWGYDLPTTRRFFEETRQPIPGELLVPNGYRKRFDHLTGPLRNQWIRWRCHKTAAFLEQVLQVLQQDRPSTRLIVAPNFFRESAAANLRSKLSKGQSVEDILRHQGLSLSDWRMPENLTVLRPFHSSRGVPEIDHVNVSRELDTIVSIQPTPGTLLVNDLTRNLENRIDHSAGASVESGLHRSMIACDAKIILHGGENLVPRRSEAVREFARLFRTLPATSFKVLEAPQPLVVRQYQTDLQTILCLGNDSAYPLRTVLAIEQNGSPEASNQLGEPIPIVEDAMGSHLVTELPPGKLTIITIESKVDVAQCSIQQLDEVQKELKSRFERLSQAMDSFRQDRSQKLQEVPENGHFEIVDDSDFATLAGWTASGSPTIAADQTNAHEGLHSLKLTGNAEDGVFCSPFKLPQTRAMALNIWCRSDKPNTRVRWVLRGSRDQTVVYKSQAQLVVGTEWSPFKVRVADLPFNRLDEVRFGFELTDSATLWLDAAELNLLAPSTKEKRAVFKTWSAMFKAWKDRRFADFQRLSEGYWARYLMEQGQPLEAGKALEAPE